ncbi:MAG: hypothetical protein KGP28_00680 [Bdellovibrionales bacterium]|nr:hypothetical protein [Bdellovibrionales bacterium]
MKSMKMVGVLVIGGFITLNAFADSSCEKSISPGVIQEVVDSMNSDPIPCLDLEETPEAGTICKTEAGYTFVRFHDGWKDVESGDRWFDEVGYGNHSAAQKHCNKKAASLPSARQLDIAYKHGLGEVLDLSIVYPDGSFPTNPTFWTNDEHKEGKCLRSILGLLKDGEACPQVKEKKSKSQDKEKKSKSQDKEKNSKPQDKEYWVFGPDNHQFAYGSEKYVTIAETAICVK